MNRRTFLKQAAAVGGMAWAAPLLDLRLAAASSARVAFVKTTDRGAGVVRAIDLLGSVSIKGKDLFIKPNFNSADPPPGSTHTDTLAALVRKLRAMGAGPLTIGDRSGMGQTRQVMESRGVFTLGRELDARVIVLDELGPDDWQVFHATGAHWSRGFALPRPALRAAGIVQTCCLKTHRFGGHFTMSLKNSVGLAAKTVPGDAYNYMRELHGSPDQRRMIAEINSAYQPDLIVLDAVDAFTSGGPDKGTLVHPGVVIAGTDRVAVDAVGVALLRHYGTTPEVSAGTVFDQEQLKRASELSVGVTAASQIEIVTADAGSEEFAQRLRPLLAA
jgi:uncharacterized protein (DUF362 family)